LLVDAVDNLIVVIWIGYFNVKNWLGKVRIFHLVH